MGLLGTPVAGRPFMTRQTALGISYGMIIAGLIIFLFTAAVPLYKDLAFLHQARLFTEAQAAQQAARPATPAAK